MMLLEEIFKSQKSKYSDAFILRIQRGLSWLKKANDLQDDLDLQFISLWVCVNAIYAQDVQLTEKKPYFLQFIDSIFNNDIHGKIHGLLWGKLQLPIQHLLNNPYIYQGYWDYQNQNMSALACQTGLAQEKQNITIALENKASATILQILFSRLYTLRKQLLNGGATYHSAINRKQLKDGCRVLSTLLPVFILLLLENVQAMDLKKPFYPSVQVC